MTEQEENTVPKTNHKSNCECKACVDLWWEECPRCHAKGNAQEEFEPELEYLCHECVEIAVKLGLLNDWDHEDFMDWDFPSGGDKLWEWIEAGVKTENEKKIMTNPEIVEIMIREFAGVLDKNIEDLRNSLDKSERLTPDQEALWWLPTGKIFAFTQSRAHVQVLQDYFGDN